MQFGNIFLMIGQIKKNDLCFLGAIIERVSCLEEFAVGKTFRENRCKRELFLRLPADEHPDYG